MPGSQFHDGRSIKILIVDDHPVMRDGLAVRLSSQEGWTVCGEASSAKEALATAESLCPDLAIVDLALGVDHGLELVEELVKRCPELKVLVVSAYDDSLYAERAIRAGAQGYLNKRECAERLLQAVRDVLAGKRVVSEAIVQRLMRQAADGGESLRVDPVQRLTNRELEVFRLIGKGLKTRAIANQLHLSVHTIDSHRERIRGKLHLANGAELTRSAVQWVIENSS